MKKQIKSKFSANILFEGEFGSMKLCVEAAVRAGTYLVGADLSGANLSGAYLVGADLSGANLSGANLSGAKFGKDIPVTREPIQLLGLQYFVLILDTHIKIGCELHSTEEWKKFDDKQILQMDSPKGLKWWSDWKDIIIAIAEKHNLVINLNQENNL